LKLHEYQAKGLFAQHGLSVPRGEVAFSPEAARKIAVQLGGRVVVKAQIHAGGRGKGGGVKLADGPEEVESITREMIGMQLVTEQTGSEGTEVSKVLIEGAVDIEREIYLGILVDRSLARTVVIASAAGGMEIEEVAAKNTGMLLRETIDPRIGLAAFQARRLVFGLKLPASSIARGVQSIQAAYRLFVECDASLLEINPLVVTRQGEMLALDGKVTIDDNALFRHPDLLALRDLKEEEPLEVEASKFSLNYIRLDGTVGCMVNGAGLAMATMDIIKLAGGEPANFLDVGGGASAEQIRNAFRILMSDSNVKAVLINIFGGILRCDVFAQGVIEAVSELDVKVPTVIRMEGTNVDQGKAMLAKSGLNFTTVGTMHDGAASAVRLARGANI